MGDRMLVTLTVDELADLIERIVEQRLDRRAALPRWHSVKDVAEALGVSETKALDMVRSGRINAVRDGGRWLIHPDALEQLANPSAA